MNRTFKSARAALGYACSVKGRAAGPASVSAQGSGRPPDMELACRIFGALANAGINPHRDGPLLEAVCAWSVGEEFEAAQAHKLDAAVTRLDLALLEAGIIEAHDEPIQPIAITHRAVEIGGRVRYHSSTGTDGAPDLAKLREDIEAGRQAPEQASPCAACPSSRDELMAACVRAYKDGDLTTREIDEAVADELEVKLPRARQLRRAAGIIATRGRKKRIDRQKTATDTT